ncbi:hypothetical protein BSKO_04198 [Bryopsis sp. KO-2023]|nr:hypothetical protein BSKO_04198 [Bryopsis sp. KO-2023]
MALRDRHRRLTVYQGMKRMKSFIASCGIWWMGAARDAFCANPGSFDDSEDAVTPVSPRKMKASLSAAAVGKIKEDVPEPIRLPLVTQSMASRPSPKDINSPSFADLPDELITGILSHVGGEDVASSSALVCRQWGRIILMDDSLWKTLYQRDFFRGQDMGKSNLSATWREEYGREYRWRHGGVTERCYEGLSSHVYSVESDAKSDVVVGRSVDGVTRVWDRDGGECLQTLVGARLMSCVQCDEKKIVGASLDGSIAVWEAETRRLLRTLVGHSHLATCLQFDDQKVISGSLDRTIRVWDVHTGECLKVLSGHKSTVMCLKLNGSILVSGSNDGAVKVWDVETGECMHTLLGHKGWVSCVDVSSELVVSGSHDCGILVWSLATGKRIWKLRGHSGSVMCVQLRGKRIVSGSIDCTVKIWDLDARVCMRTLRGHKSYVSCVKFDNEKVLSGGDDGTVRCWQMIE